MGRKPGKLNTLGEKSFWKTLTYSWEFRGQYAFPGLWAYSKKVGSGWPLGSMQAESEDYLSHQFFDWVIMICLNWAALQRLGDFLFQEFKEISTQWSANY